MTATNPYQAPSANIQSDADPEISTRMEKLASGQKLVIYAVLLYFIAAALRMVIGPVVFVFLLASLVMSLIGLFKVLSTCQSSIVVKTILFLLLFVPLINLLVLLSVNSRATKTLREAGYRVGFMGASK